MAKTDKIDAKILSEYGQRMNPEEKAILKTESENNLADLVKRRDELLKEKQQESNRLERLRTKIVEKSIKRHIQWLETELAEINEQISNFRENCVEIKEKCDLLTSVPGVGNIVATHFVAYLPELGKLSHEKIAALVGVAPFNRESGQFRGKRNIQGGRSKLRRMLYMSAVASLKWNNEMRSFYDRLKSKGKQTKVAIVAVMRKLLTVLNSIATRKQPWVQKNLVMS